MDGTTTDSGHWREDQDHKERLTLWWFLRGYIQQEPVGAAKRLTETLAFAEQLLDSLRRHGVPGADAGGLDQTADPSKRR